MKYTVLTPQDKAFFEGFFRKTPHELSPYSFQSVYIWRDLFTISYAVIEGALCIFFKDKDGVFLYVPPLGEGITVGTLRAVFGALRTFNTNPAIARIENIEEKDLPRYQKAGYTCARKSDEYVCRNDALIGLRGDDFKSKRAAYNHFTKHYSYGFRDFRDDDAPACITLYEQWMNERREKSEDRVYRAMLKDGFEAFRIVAQDCARLGYEGAVVEIEGCIKGCTFGYPLNSDTFCVAYEIADLSHKGIAQYMFREFCRAHARYAFINIMDDSGLESLKKVKLSYRPYKMIPSYIAKETA
jgi:hypothetical protein